MSIMTQKSPHWLSLNKSTPVFQNDLGSVQMLDVTSFPILRRLSIKRLILAPRATREPQWNVNANQLAYVVRGQVLVSMLDDADKFASFVGADVLRRVGSDLPRGEPRRR
jgi:oxalate decarboxylase